MNIEIKSEQEDIRCTVSLKGSKSISNRVLIIRALSGLSFEMNNISESQDTELLQNALKQVYPGNTLDVNHAGTSFRFLTALLAAREGESFELTGSSRLKQRPVGELVNVLRQLGAAITFLEKDGYPPLKIEGKKLEGGKLSIRGDISSQFITALLLIAPTFTKGLQLEITTPLVSKPYVDMTVALMREFGGKVVFEGNTITVEPAMYAYTRPAFNVEGDWSSAGYWYHVAALSESADITLENLFAKSTQADQAVAAIYAHFGIQTEWLDQAVRISKQGNTHPAKLVYDFVSCPDAAQTVAATCAGLGVAADFTGLQTLTIKETDRIAALKNELGRLGVNVQATEDSISQQGTAVPSKEMIHTYHDHRMALSFAPLALVLGSLKIEDKDVISKSYPNYWEDLQKAGFSVTPLEN